MYTQKEKTGIWIINDDESLMINLINGEARLKNDPDSQNEKADSLDNSQMICYNEEEIASLYGKRHSTKE